MSCIHLPTYKYLYVNRSNDLRIKELNVFQKWVLRRVFGCYAKTHLQNFATRAYPLTFNERFTKAAKAHEQSFLTALRKAQIFYKSDGNLREESLPSGTHVTIRTTCQIADVIKDKKMDGVVFNFIFKNETDESSLKVQIIRDKVVPVQERRERSKVRTKPSFNVFWPDLMDSKKGDQPEEVSAKATQEEVVYINKFIADLLRNSKEEKFVCDFQSYFELNTTLKQEENQTLNKAQQNSMETLGWKLDPSKAQSRWRRFVLERSALPSKVEDEEDPDTRISFKFYSTFIQPLVD